MMIYLLRRKINFWSLRQALLDYVISFDLVTLTLMVDLLFSKNLWLIISFERQELGLWDFTYAFLASSPFWRHTSFNLVTLILTFDLLICKFTVGHNFWMVRDRPFVFDIWIYYVKSFWFSKFKLVTLTFDLLFSQIYDWSYLLNGNR